MAASQWINTIPVGDTRNSAVKQLVTVQVQNGSDLPTAFVWASSITGNNTMHGNQMNNVVSQWARKDPNAAAAAVQSAAASGSVSDAELTRLMTTIQSVAPKPSN
jgi:hypothetical protein